MTVSLRLNEKEEQALENLMVGYGESSKSALIRKLITKRRVLPDITSDIATLYKVANGVLAKVQERIILIESKDDLVNLAEDLNKSLIPAREILEGYAYMDDDE
jgi:hypothetical protein